jgi:pSer/pThr/pTyr-binding forkhead associated (FHA) protein
LRNGDIIEMTRAKITCAIEQDKVVSAEPGEGTQAIAARAVQGILGRLGEAKSEGPFLRVLTGLDENVRYPLAAPLSEWTLGRSKDCECVLNDANVSRRHATIKKDWNGYVIQDLGSKNGVLINERAITKSRRLKDRDEITIGPVKLIFIDPDAGLLDALKGVPGFEVEDSESQLIDLEQQEAESKSKEDSGTPMLSPSVEAKKPEVAEPPEEDEMAQLDPKLLEEVPARTGVDIAIMVSVAILAILAGFTMYLMIG